MVAPSTMEWMPMNVGQGRISETIFYHSQTSRAKQFSLDCEGR
jgi:hypothetical protein